MLAKLNLAQTSPLTSEHAQQLDGLIETLSPEEAIWISGYLAGFVRRAQSAAQAANVAPAASSTPILIVYGSETGHAAALAERTGELARQKGLFATVKDTAEFRPQDLKAVKRLVVVTSTHGEGTPPDTAADFYEFLHGRKAPKLDGVKFAVLGLGDSTYEHFCQTGKDVDKRLQELGAERIHARADCDVDYEDQADQWIEAVLGFFTKEDGPSTPKLSVVQGSGTTGASATAHPQHVYGAKNPFPATLLESITLNGRGSDKETRHIELSLADSGLTYEPGDSLGVVPQNDPAMVDELIEALKLDSEERVPLGSAGEAPLREALSHHYEITVLTPRFLELYGGAAEAATLRSLTAAGNRSELMAYTAGRQVIDVVTEFPVEGLGGKALVEMLRRLQPRLYSLASSLEAYPEEAHLTVSVVRYDSHGRKRKGVASAHLAERCELDGTVPVYVEHNKNFRLPADGSAPVIMVGAGTGVAPFRSFLQHREAADASGRNWLFFGERHFRTDFLYQLEWQRFLKDGLLNRMDVAFSRDQDEKVYVQRRLLERGREVYGWLEEGAHLYVCGDANGMAPDVHAALIAILGREGGLAPEQAEDYLKRLQREKRYQRDVY
ncbi:assimilatory sulfite reductase (NADPH) flavoprotein subunit [Rhodospirillaceae bacterium SYSU D60014]|uniref:assimilatory sulfite reductase (NADPH) flavoprotein subunit n=1 Tax=Virgifigura deserti TaxID=2268457 RepID=UPI000E65EC35